MSQIDSRCTDRDCKRFSTQIFWWTIKLTVPCFWQIGNVTWRNTSDH